MEVITEDYVSFDTARLLKEKGFDAKCDKCYAYFADDDIRVMDLKYPKSAQLLIENRYPCPTLQMAMKWLRIKHSIHIESFCPVVDTTDEPVKYNVVISDLRNYCLAFNTPLEDKEFDSYEKACEAAIKYCLENLVY